jgi:hypothetical protein
MIRPSQPQSIGGVLDTTFQLFRAALLRVLPLAILSAIAGSVATVYLVVKSLVGNSDNPVAAIEGAQDLTYWMLYAIGVALSLWAAAAVYLQMNAIGNGEHDSVGAALAQAAGRIPALLLMLVLLVLVLIAGFVLLLIPGFILMVSLLFSLCVLLFEGKGPVDSLRSSHRLVWGSWWRTTAILTVGFIIILVMYVVAGVLVGLAIPFLSIAADSVLLVGLLTGLFVNAVVALIATPFYVALFIAIYWDLKLRKEGGDLAARVGMLGAT